MKRSGTELTHRQHPIKVLKPQTVKGSQSKVMAKSKCGVKHHKQEVQTFIR